MNNNSSYTINKHNSTIANISEGTLLIVNDKSSSSSVMIDVSVKFRTSLLKQMYSAHEWGLDASNSSCEYDYIEQTKVMPTYMAIGTKLLVVKIDRDVHLGISDNKMFIKLTLQPLFYMSTDNERFHKHGWEFHSVEYGATFRASDDRPNDNYIGSITNIHKWFDVINVE